MQRPVPPQKLMRGQKLQELHGLETDVPPPRANHKLHIAERLNVVGVGSFREDAEKTSLEKAAPVKLSDAQQGSSGYDMEALKAKMAAAEEKMARVLIQGTERNFKFITMSGQKNSKYGISVGHLDDVEDVDLDSSTASEEEEALTG
eukprot:CAMPEP_0194734296 /NCGR_PEP_ID=MMETSP0296-20130528/68986_1 /TAXON_ID=39354 /ORGANISM="Heterosigma akashiwo, Strain CCMP2393" /LENGTH=146 /DNA_ID=CAMNT_0039643029 /DNA_START=224 /DNA_END=660 /DNA_ORIENTATION=-